MSTAHQRDTSSFHGNLPPVWEQHAPLPVIEHSWHSGACCCRCLIAKWAVRRHTGSESVNQNWAQALICAARRLARSFCPVCFSSLVPNWNKTVEELGRVLREEKKNHKIHRFPSDVQLLFVQLLLLFFFFCPYLKHVALKGPVCTI